VRLQALRFHSELFPATDTKFVAAVFRVSQQGGPDLSEVVRENGELKVASLRVSTVLRYGLLFFWDVTLRRSFVCN